MFMQQVEPIYAIANRLFESFAREQILVPLSSCCGIGRPNSFAAATEKI